MSDKARAAYEEVLHALYASRRSGIDLGLERVRTTLESLRLEDGGSERVVQIAGTNGKGSTARYLECILRESGYRVGVFSSPHLMSLCERFTIEGLPVTQAELAAAYRSLSSSLVGLPFFEQVTILAAWLFRERGVDLAIFEVGLGGRLDSTTAVNAQVSIVTGIALDHCEYLGSELSQIAEEKAGVYRKGAAAIVGLSAPAKIRSQLVRLAEAVGAHPLVVDDSHRVLVPDDLKMRGNHQRDNAASAAAAALALRDRGMALSESAIRAGLAGAEIAGRLEEVEEGLWVDGAHNAQAARALADAIEARAPWVFVVGLSTGKNVAEFLAPLESMGSVLIATEFDSERSCGAQEVAAAGQGFATVEVHPQISSALQRARELAEGRPILVTGSLLLLGELLATLGFGPVDPFLVTDPGPKPGAQAK